jgi:hypothetical protein
MDEKLFNRNQLGKLSCLEFPFVNRVITKTGLKPKAKTHGGIYLFSLAEWTEALEKYRNRTHKEDLENPSGTPEIDLENEKLREVIRGLRLKNDILANKLIYREDVYNYISQYVSAELTRVKRICVQKLVLKARNKTAQELHKIGIDLYNDYLNSQSIFVQNWVKKSQLDSEQAESDETENYDNGLDTQPD